MISEIAIGAHPDGPVSFDMANASNRHISIIGRSGSGKSVAGQKIIKNIVTNGDCPVIVLDMHRLFCAENIFPEFSKEIQKLSFNIDVYTSGISLPLFTPLKHTNGRTEEQLDVITSIVEVLSTAIKLGARQKECLFEAIDFVAEKKSYESQGILALDRALDMIDDEKAVSIRNKLRYVVQKNVFRHGPVFFKNKRINVLQLSQFSESMQALVAEIILAFIWRMANTGAFVEKGLCLYLDECQNLEWGKTGIISTILSEGRKLGLQLIMITQGLGGNRSDLNQCLFQAANQLYFLPPENQTAIIAKLIAPKKNPYWQLRLKSLSVGECVANGTFAVNGAAYNGALKIKI